MKVEVLTPHVVDEVAALIAREHRHLSDRGVPLPGRYLSDAACDDAVHDLLSEGYSGFVARDGAHLVGAMCGRTAGLVGFVPAHALALDHAVLDPSRVLADLFGELAPILVADGAERVTIDHVAHGSLAGALFDLGFGQGGTFAVRGTHPLGIEPTVDVRVGTITDLDSIAELSHIEFLHRSAAPMYALEPTRSLTDTRAAHAVLLDDDAIHLLAHRDGRDIGLLTIEHTTPAPRLCATGAPYIGPTATDPAARRRGVGRALVEAAFAWARTGGHDTISVDFDSRNPRSRPFWIGNGFRPTGHRSRRVLTH